MRAVAVVLAAMLLASGLGSGGEALAEPATDAGQLVQIRDDKQLAEALAAIVQVPAVHVDDAKVRPLAQMLMMEGVHRLAARATDQALANFLEAYNRLPSPTILLVVASTLRDMGRLADAANTYQRYIADPATGADRVDEVKQLLISLDEQLTILTVRVYPHGSDVSIDGGPFVPVGSSLVTRVRPGIHLVRIRKGTASSELTVNGFEGETKEVSATLKVDADDKSPEPDAPEHVDGWLITGTQYSGGTATGRERRVHAGNSEVAPIVPHYEVSDTREGIVDTTDEPQLESGVIGLVRIDTGGRCCAGGVGLAISLRGRWGLDVAGLRSNEWGLYVGLRYRLLSGWLRPYLAAGAPVFAFTSDMSTQIAPGLRAALGAEIVVNAHLSVAADVGIEHFFNVGGTTFEDTVYVPTLGAIGRL